MTLHPEHAGVATVTVEAHEAHGLLVDALKSLGVDDADVDVAAQHFLAAEERGRGGINRLTQLARSLDPQGPGECAPIAVVRETAATALVDGGGHLGYAVADHTTRIAIAKAKANGIAAVAANNHRYSGVLGHYVELVAREGLVAIAVGSGNLPVVAPFGGRTAGLCTNPIAFGFPTPGEPIVWDAASASVSGHLLEIAQRLGQPLPEGAAVDESGQLTRDPASARAGALFAWGGHRGSGLAVAIQLLGLLANIGADLHNLADWEGAFLMIAIDPSRFLAEDQFQVAAAEFAEGIRATPPAQGHDAVRMPSDRSLGGREDRRRAGFEVDATELDELRRLANRRPG